MNVIVYGAEWCPWCHKVKDWLKENKVKFEYKDVDEGNNAAEAVKASGQTGVPVTMVDKKAIVGFDIPKLKEALKIK